MSSVTMTLTSFLIYALIISSIILSFNFNKRFILYYHVIIIREKDKGLLATGNSPLERSRKAIDP